MSLVKSIVNNRTWRFNGFNENGIYSEDQILNWINKSTMLSELQIYGIFKLGNPQEGIDWISIRDFCKFECFSKH
jgi:hypothetical protein